MLGKVGIVVQPGNLHWTNGKKFVFQFAARPIKEPFKRVEFDVLHARDRLYERGKFAHGNALPKGQAIGMKEAPFSVGQHTITEQGKQGSFNMTTQVVRIDTDGDIDVERYVGRGNYGKVVTYTTIVVQIAPDFAQHSRTRAFPTNRVNRDDYFIPAPRPEQQSGGLLQLDPGIALSQAGIVISSDCSLEFGAKGSWRELFDLIQRLGVYAATGRERIVRFQSTILRDRSCFTEY